MFESGVPSSVRHQTRSLMLPRMKTHGPCTSQVDRFWFAVASWHRCILPETSRQMGSQPAPGSPCGVCLGVGQHESLKGFFGECFGDLAAEGSPHPGCRLCWDREAVMFLLASLGPLIFHALPAQVLPPAGQTDRGQQTRCHTCRWAGRQFLSPSSLSGSEHKPSSSS